MMAQRGCLRNKQAPYDLVVELGVVGANSLGHWGPLLRIPITLPCHRTSWPLQNSWINPGLLKSDHFLVSNGPALVGFIGKSQTFLYALLDGC
jgi:hypothetical protein